MCEPIVITSDNLSIAWAEAFIQILKPGTAPSLIVQIDTSNGGITEDKGIRSLLSQALLQRPKCSTIETVANTIFPNSLWNLSEPRQRLFERYEAIWPKIKKCRANRNGVYFQRLIAFPDFGDDKTNQLDYIIRTYTCGNHRHSAHQAAIYAPAVDATDQRQRGFPCLQQVAFSIDQKRNMLMVIAFYPTQGIFEKAYGNYLGLCRLGVFMAHELDMKFGGMQCFASHPRLIHGGKTALQPLGSEIAGLVSNCLTRDA